MTRYKNTIIFDEKLIKTVNDLKEYWPLTVRQVFYRCVSDLSYGFENTKNEYQKISKRLTFLRENDLLSWLSIQDNTRPVSFKKGYSDLNSYIDIQFSIFLKDYDRCLVQNQDEYVEVWTEKKALFSIIEKTVKPYCVRAVSVGGQSSTTALHDYVNRLKRTRKPGLILYYGDFDPTGIAIPKSIEKKLQNIHEVDVRLERKAIDAWMIASLPKNNIKPKEKDNNLPKFIEEFGDIGLCELDALNPPDLIDMIQNDLDEALDREIEVEERKIERREKLIVKNLRAEVVALIESKGFILTYK